MHLLSNLLIYSSLALFTLSLNAQNVTISDNPAATPDLSAMLDVQSTAKGVLVPRMDSTLRKNISSPAIGLLVFDTSTESFWFKTTSGWMELISDVKVNNSLSGNGTAANPLGLAQNGATNGQVLTWNGSTWEPQTFTSVLPSGTTTGQVLTWNGSSWQADDPAYGVPVGTIIAYADANAPAGYLPCNGSAVSPFVYPKLYSAIGTTWGGTPDVFFNLPDLRGQFLRGYSGSSNDDPDKNARTAKNPGGATGNNVGSYQSDEIKSHSHGDIYGGNGNFGQMDNNTGNPQGVIGNILIPASGGSESRPKNANVFYIIKY